LFFFFFFFNDTATTEIYTLSLHDALPISDTRAVLAEVSRGGDESVQALAVSAAPPAADTKAPAHSSSMADPRAAARESPPPAYQLAPAAGASKQIPPQHAKARRLQWILAGGLTAVLAIFLLYRLAPWNGATTVQPIGIISIAVLPFANLSGDTAQEYFSDGMTEEITTALTRIPDLRVVARLSAGQFKGEKKDVRAIGQALGATHLIEGTVRKDGSRVRITAQLVQSDNGLNLWSASFDRNLTDVFATQEEIARTIIGSLMTPLGLTPGEQLVANRNIDAKSYDEYLQAKALYRARDLPAAIKLLEPVVVRAPGFAPAWGLLAQIYVVAQNFSIEVRSGSEEEARLAVQTSQDKAEMAARESIRLDSRNAVGYAVLARVQAIHRRNWATGDDLFKQALALDPNEPDVLLNYDITLAGEGRLKEALNVMERLRKVEPFVPIFNIVLAHDLHLNGQRQAAIAMFGTMPPDAGGAYWRNLWLAEAYAAAGRYAEAADTLLLMPSRQIDRRFVEDAARLLRNASENVTAPPALPTLARELSFVYAYVGAPDRAMENYARMIEVQVDDSVWLPELAPLRKTERFKALVRQFGLVDYWRARGWPDLCRPVGTDDFECE